MSWLEDAQAKVKKFPDDVVERRQMCLDDLWVFAQTMNPGYLYGDIHKEIYRWMAEYTLFGRGDALTANKLVMLPRAHLKSHMVATWAAWIITRHPEITILYVSATSGLAETQLYAIKNILTSGPFQYFFPEYIHPQEGKREKWNNTEIMLDHPDRAREGIRDATISTAGLTTNTTGWHADIICADDLVVPENAYTERGRDEVRNKTSQFTSIRNTGGFTMAAGTRYHPSDIYDTWKLQEYEVYDKEENLVDKLPTWSIVEHAVEVDNIFLWPRAVNSNNKAFGFDLNSLARIRSEYEDKVQFHAQYYNDPNDAGSNRIDRNMFQYIEPRHLQYRDGNWYCNQRRLNVYAGIDFAYTVTKKADFTAVVVIGQDSLGYIYVLDIDQFKTDKIKVMFDHVADLHSKWSFRKLRAETTAAQSMIAGDLKDKIREEGMSLAIEEHKPNRTQGSKEERMAAVLEPRYENQTVYHMKGGWTNTLEEQLIMARPKNDDIKDCLASVIEIARKPAKERDNSMGSKVTVGKFGGVAFNRRR